MSGIPCEKNCERCRMAGPADGNECNGCKSPVDLGYRYCESCRCVMCVLMMRAPGREVCHSCMTWRDEFARAALTGMLAHSTGASSSMSHRDYAERAYGLADEMIAARAR